MAVRFCLRSTKFYGSIAQLVEHMLCKHGVIGSNPFISKFKNENKFIFISNLVFYMKYMLLKDRRRRILVASYEFRRTWLKALYQNQKLNRDFRNYVYTQILNLSKDISTVRLRNRCVLTNRPRGIYRKFGLSRLMFRKYVSQCKLVGIRKASW